MSRKPILDAKLIAEAKRLGFDELLRKALNTPPPAKKPKPKK